MAAYLATLDIALFDPKAPPPKTQAFWAIVDAHCAPEDAELADVLDSIGVRMPDGTVTWPDAVTLPDITRAARAAGSSFLTWITDRKSRRAIPHRMEQCGYVPVRNDRHRVQWIINGTRQVVYAKSDQSGTELRRLNASVPEKFSGLRISARGALVRDAPWSGCRKSRAVR